jgi:hypothetical protein
MRYNMLRNINGPTLGAYGGANGIYLDDQMSSAEIYGNIFFDVYRGVLLGGGNEAIFYS